MKEVDTDFDFDTWGDIYNNDDSDPLDNLDCPRVRDILMKALKIKNSLRITSVEFYSLVHGSLPCVAFEARFLDRHVPKLHATLSPYLAEVVGDCKCASQL